MLTRLLENWALKLLSLVFALILWFFVMGEQKLERSYAVPLELKNIPSGMMVANEVPSQVEVRIAGPRTLLMNLRIEDIRISVDLKDLQPGLTSFKRLEERLDIPGPLKVTRLSPSYVDVRLDHIDVRTVPVRPLVQGRPAEGFTVEKVLVRPDKVTLEGAGSELAHIQFVETVVVDISDAREGVTVMRSIDHRGRYTRVKEPLVVEVQVSIAGPEPDSGQGPSAVRGRRSTGRLSQSYEKEIIRNGRRSGSGQHLSHDHGNRRAAGPRRGLCVQTG
jgi:YbbR domain-containing protein